MVDALEVRLVVGVKVVKVMRTGLVVLSRKTLNSTEVGPVLVFPFEYVQSGCDVNAVIAVISSKVPVTASSRVFSIVLLQNHGRGAGSCVLWRIWREMGNFLLTLLTLLIPPVHTGFLGHR